MKADGFDRMDVATDIVHDVKFRRLARLHPDLVAAAGWAYVSLLGDSWREGERLTLDETWPPGVTFDPAVGEALVEAELVDDDGRVTEHAWSGWYGAAHERRERGRERQRRADAKRGRVSSPAPPSSSSDRLAGRPAGRQAGPSPDHHRSSDGPDLQPGRGGTTEPPLCIRCERRRQPGEDMDPVFLDGAMRWTHRGSCPGTAAA